MRAQDGGSKLLNVIPVPPNGYTSSFLKKVVHCAKVYIRPLQKDLSLDPATDEVYIMLIGIVVTHFSYMLCFAAGSSGRNTAKRAMFKM